jgi:hypothetical protein
LASEVVGKAPGRLSILGALTFAVASLPLYAVDVAMLIYLPPHLSGHLGVPLERRGRGVGYGEASGYLRRPSAGRGDGRDPLAVRSISALDGGRSPDPDGGDLDAVFAKPGVGGLYLVGWLLALYLGRSILHLAHPAWAATLAKSYNERSRLYGIMAAVGVASALMVLSLPVINAALHGPDSRNIELMGWFVIGLAPVMVGLAVWRTGERISPSTHASGPNLTDYLRLLTKPDLVRLYLSHIALTLGPGWMTALYIFFTRDYKGLSASQASILLLVYTVAGLFGAPMTAHPGHQDRQGTGH